MMEDLKYPASLTKENFWNELQKKYPKQMEVFCKWIDDYKKRVEWDMIFTSNRKFHDIPIAMQIGILMEFTMSQEPDYEQLKMDMLSMVRNMIETVKI